jgi:hypothetical protein
LLIFEKIRNHFGEGMGMLGEGMRRSLLFDGRLAIRKGDEEVGVTKKAYEPLHVDGAIEDWCLFMIDKLSQV